MTTAKCPKLQLKIKKMNSQLADFYLALATTFLIKFKALKLLLASTEQVFATYDQGKFLTSIYPQHTAVSRVFSDSHPLMDIKKKEFVQISD